jgi:hypothetical protein
VNRLLARWRVDLHRRPVGCDRGINRSHTAVDLTPQILQPGVQQRLRGRLRDHQQFAEVRRQIVEGDVEQRSIAIAHPEM